MSNDTGDVSSNKDDIAKDNSNERDNEVGKQQANDDLKNKQDEKEKGTRGNEEKTPIIKNRVPRKEIDSLALGKTWKNEKLQIIDEKQRSTRKKMGNNQTQGE
jgi:hypothetical protein